MFIKFVTPSGPHTTCCLCEQAVRVFRIPVTSSSSLSNCSHVSLFGQQYSKECFFFWRGSTVHFILALPWWAVFISFFFQLMLWCCLHPMMHGNNVFYHCIMWRARPAAASGARAVGTLPIAMHLQEPGEVDCRNQKVLSSKGKCVLHYKLQNYNGKFGIFST